MKNYKELIVGKAYKRYDRYTKLYWGFSKFSVEGVEICSTFIFLGFIPMKFETDRFTIKALVDGKLLYASGCDKIDFYFEEIK